VLVVEKARGGGLKRLATHPPGGEEAARRGGSVKEGEDLAAIAEEVRPILFFAAYYRTAISPSGC